MKIGFLFNAPHRLHASWAESVSADFICDKVKGSSIAFAISPAISKTKIKFID